MKTLHSSPTFQITERLINNKLHVCFKIGVQGFTLASNGESSEENEKRAEMLRVALEKLIKSDQEKIDKLTFMIENGLGWEDMENDNKPR